MLIYLRDGSAGVPIECSAAPNRRRPMARARASGGRSASGAQILRDLGVSSIRLRTDNPRTYVGLSGFGIEIAAVEPIEG